MRQIGKLLRAGLLIGAILVPCLSEALLVSTIISGRGGATVALPTDSFVAAYNPAGIAWTGDRWDFGLNWQRDWGQSTIAGNADPNNNGRFFSHHKSENFLLPEIGVSKDLCICPVYLTIGFLVYDRNFSKTNYPTNIPIFGTTRLGLEYLQETASIVLAIRFSDQHTLGASIDFVGQRLKVNGLQNFANAVQSVSPHHVTNKGYQYSLGIGATVGWLSRVSDCVSFGLAFQPEIVMRHMKGYNGLLAKHGKLNLPQRALGGFCIQFLPGTYVDFDVEYVSWNQIAAIEHPLLPNLFHKPSFGSEKGVGLGWRPVIHYRVGIEWEIWDCVAVRAGYTHTRTPVRKKEALFNMLTPNVVEHFASVGATWCINCDNEISGFVTYGFRNTVFGPHAIPDVFGGGSVRLMESRTFAGISWARHF